MPAKKLSRSQMNKQLRQILTRYKVDISELQTTCSPHTINLVGRLVKLSKTEFTVEELLILKAELSSITKNITTRLSNWDLCGSSIVKLEKGKKTKFK